MLNACVRASVAVISINLIQLFYMTFRQYQIHLYAYIEIFATNIYTNLIAK